MSKTCDFLGLSKENGNLLGWVFWLVGLVFFFYRLVVCGSLTLHNWLEKGVY